ncbi:alpha/beta hydrolase [Curtobacterium sp. Leaf261]|uniref:alpha/beta hydrolase n=1 Tax=Curtobacterium sp. Leaf261 TaxID=1736311 RepID=UPI0006F6C7B9|nr:alpha/beta hydrolase [Curtobacterium sp. Leaf261]KQO63417.1 hypothetical protein ASF23_03905 [Curtobacterium sp. Leaf261]
MTERLVVEADLPVVRVDPGAVTDVVRDLRTSTGELQRAGDSASSAWAGIGRAFEVPGVTDALASALQSVPRRAAALADVGESVASALDAFAEAVATLKRSRKRLLEDIAELHARVRRLEGDGDGGGDVPPECRELNADLHDQASAARRGWTAAQATLTAALQTAAGGSSLLPGVGAAASVPSLLVAPVDFAAVVERFTSASFLPLLAELSRGGARAVSAWRRHHRAEWDRHIAATMSASDVARWWGGLDADQRTALVMGASGWIGSLNGVAYSDRGRANQHRLDVMLPKYRRQYEVMSARIGVGLPFTAVERAAYALLAERIAALAAIKATLADTRADRPRTVVSLTLGHPPLAAIAVGDLDAASQVTVNVPGMGNTVAQSTRGWVGGAENLWIEEQQAASALHIDDRVAVVAWIGYDTPDMPPSGEVLLSTKARAGATNLSAFLDGVSGTRGWSGGRHVSVVAHSYGTTTATLATSTTPVSNLTLLASAGVDRSIADADAVNVPRGHVWASQASNDYIANVGRGSVENAGVRAGHGQPNVATGTRSQTLKFWSEHPLNPVDDKWGARTFPSDAETINGAEYLGSDGHSATPATDAVDRHQPVTEHGYLDAGTSSVRNAAYTSLGYSPDGKKIP